MKRQGELTRSVKRRSPRGRLLSILLAVCMMITMLPVTVLAIEDPLISIDVSDTTVNEADGSATFNISLLQTYGSDITINYNTSNGTASAPYDYTTTSGTATIPAGNTLATVTIPTIIDSIDEEDESFYLDISSQSAGVITDSQGKCIIYDNDDPPTVSISDATVTEGNSGTANLIYTVALSSESGKVVTVDYATQDWTATLDDNDYIASSGKIYFALGETSRTITITVNADTTLEANETVLVNLANPFNVSISDGQGSGTITNDDTDTTPPTAPTAVIVTPVGGTVIANALNRSSTNMTATATIIADDATGGKAELYLNSTLLATDNAILSGETQVTFDIGKNSVVGLRGAIPSSGTVSVKLYDAAGNSSISSVGNPYLTVDYTNPTSSRSPANNSTNIDVNTNLVIVFSENMSIGTGNIVIKKVSNNSVVESIDVTSGQVTGNGTNTITINPSVTLNSNTAYYVLIDGTAFDDISGNNSPGIDNTTSWRFTTGDVAKAITAFNFNGLIPNVTGTVDEASKTIALTVPYGTDVTELVPTITHTGASASPNTGVAQNFTSPVEYTITAADSSTQKYTVTVTVADPVDITAASVIITAPVPGEVPQVTAAVEEATANDDYTVTNITWNEPLTAGGKFKAGQVYTATVALTSKNSKKFQAAAFTPTVAGSSSVGTTTTSGDVVGNTVSFTVTFAATGALEVSSIAVITQPTKMSYTESTDSVLALNGMQVTETNNDGSTNVVSFTDGTAAGYTTNPANSSSLTNAIHNGHPVVITHTTSGMTATTNNLTVNTAPSDGGGGGSGNSTPVPPPAPVITVSEVKSELFEKAEDIKVEADVTSAFGQSVEVKITDSTESEEEIFSLAGADSEVYPFDISLYSRGSNQKVQPKDGYSVKLTIPVPEKLLEDREQIKVVYGKDGKLETLKSELIEKNGKWYIIFEATHFSPYALIVSAEPAVIWTKPFSDVKEGDWYYSSVQYVAQNGLMVGTGSNTFSPGITTNRGMIATILYRLSGSSETLQSTFKDVIPGAYYANAVAWAQEKGIIAGYGNGMFGPEDSITREQMAAILWRYAGSPVPADSNGLAAFKDAVEISSYAKNALVWAHQQGILAGKGNGILDPKGYATRAEVATIIINYLNAKEK